MEIRWYDSGVREPVEVHACTYFGMPGEAVKLGAACKILAPSEIVAEINRLINL